MVRRRQIFRKGGSPEKAVASASRLSLGQLRATKGFRGGKGVPGRRWVGRLLLLSSRQGVSGSSAQECTLDSDLLGPDPASLFLDQPLQELNIKWKRAYCGHERSWDLNLRKANVLHLREA